jgi:hypothetical protein
MCNQPPPWPFPRNPDIVAQERAQEEAQEIEIGLQANVPRCLNTGDTTQCTDGPRKQSRCDLCEKRGGLGR